MAQTAGDWMPVANAAHGMGWIQGIVLGAVLAWARPFGRVAAGAATLGLLFVAIGDGIPSPFKGGTHYAIPIALEIGLSTGIGGDFSLPAVIPASCHRVPPLTTSAPPWCR